MPVRKFYFSERLAFDPKRVFLVLANSEKDNRIVYSVHMTRAQAEKAATTLQVEQPHVDAEVTVGVLMPNFNVQ